MKAWLLLVAAFPLWPGCSSQNACEEPEDIDFGEIVSTEKAKYLENDQLQYKCNLGYVLEGPEWIQCKGQKWTPRPPKCLAPCRITRQQLATKNLLVFGSQRKARVIQSNHSLQFLCNEGYVLVVPSVRKCVDGYIELPLCISERGKNCSGPPRIENGDIITLSAKEYRSGSSVEFRCQNHYAMEGQNRSFCDNGAWTKVPICLDPCVIPRTELESQKIEVKNGTDVPENIFVQRGLSIELTCRTGYVLAENSSQSAFVVHCDGTSPVIPKCKEITCNSPRISNGSFRPQRTVYHDGDLIRIRCDSGFTFEPNNGEQVVECTKNGWSPLPKCVRKPCGSPGNSDYASFELVKGEDFTFGARVIYTCNKGYKMLSQFNYRDCQANGWTNEVPRCERKGCNSVRIENGRMENYEQFPKWEGEQFRFYCYKGFLPISKETWQTVTCTNSRFEPEPKCFKKCDPSLRFYYGQFLYNYRNSYIEGDNITFVCDTGYSPANQQSTITCTKKGWSPAPKCILQDVRCSPPEIEHGQITGIRKAKYFTGEKVQYRCNTGYVVLGNSFITCLKEGWTEIPRCTVIAGKCGRPPPVENGDIVDTPKLSYLHSESVFYQCQNYYTMEGSSRVTCQHGHWSQTPTCRVACTASEEDMRVRNIRLRWTNGDTLYSTDGTVVEFVCLRGYELHPSSGPLRVNCVEGKFDYPYCIRYN